MSVLNTIVGTYTVQYAAGNINTTVEGYSPEQIRAELATQYAELRNATINVNNGVVTFSLPSGQKNG